MKILLLSFALLLISIASTQAQNTIVEDGHVYVHVTTASELQGLGVSINQPVAYDAAKRMRAAKNYKCKRGRGGCFCNAVVAADDTIVSADFPEQQDGLTGEEIPEQLGIKAYYNDDLDEVIFR